MMRSILDRVALGAAHWAKVHNPTIVESGHNLEQEGHVTAGCTLVQMHVTDWAEAQREDPMLSVVLDWLKAQTKDRFEGTSGGTCLQQGRPTDLTESTEF